MKDDLYIQRLIKYCNKINEYMKSVQSFNDFISNSEKVDAVILNLEQIGETAKKLTSIKTIADELGVSSATISYHMNEFLTTGILYMSKESKQKFDYRVDYDKLEEVFKDLKEDLNFK